MANKPTPPKFHPVHSFRRSEWARAKPYWFEWFLLGAIALGIALFNK